MLNTIFLSTPSARRATLTAAVNLRLMSIFLSTPSARRATQDIPLVPLIDDNFYPRPPRGGRRIIHVVSPPDAQFLSTPSARRATRSGRNDGGQRVFLSTPSARRATGTATRTWTFTRTFLSTPSARRATVAKPYDGGAFVFLSTPSARRATSSLSSWMTMRLISIHALREEGDRPFLEHCRLDCISIHALREEGDPGGR